MAAAQDDAAGGIIPSADSPFVRAPKLAEPPLLEAGLARNTRPREEGLMDMLGLSNLPIPRLLKRCGGLFEPGRPAAAPATKGDAP